MPTIEELEKGFSLGEWEVLPKKGVLRRGDEEVRPEPKVLAVLLVLAKRDGDLVTQDLLIDEAWDGRAYSNEPIQRCIALLRRHLHDTKPFEYIETLQRRGYRLLKRVELHEQPEVLPVEPVPAKPSDARLWKVIAAIVAIGFVAIAALTWYPQKEPAVRSLAILPVGNLSADPSNAYIAEGIKNTLAHRLTELPEFTIKNARIDYKGSPSKIAKKLRVESVLYASVQLQDDALRVVFEIVRGRDGVTLLAGEESGQLSNLFALQERLANVVRDELAGSKTPQLITRREPDSTAYNSYMRGMYELELRFDGDNLENAIALFEESIRLDEHYGPAYLGLATAYTLWPDYRDAPLREWHDLAIETIEEGVSQDPGIEDPAGAIHGFVEHQKKEWTKSEAAYRRAIGASVVDSNAFSSYSRMLASVGRLEDSRDMVLKAEGIDPDNAVVNSRIAMVYTWLGNTGKAREYFERANELGATGEIHMISEALLLLRDEDAEKSMKLAHDSSASEQRSTQWIEPFFRALGDPTHGEEALLAINKDWADRVVLPEIVLFARTFLGDIDGAMDIARLLEEEGEAFSTEIIFVPELAPLRQRPDFYPLLERLGIAAYWDELGCNWDGDRVHCVAG